MIEKTPFDFVKEINTVGEDIFKWDCSILGPDHSPYSGGTFVLRIEFPAQYPFKAPTLKFMTKIYHPSIKVHFLFQLLVIYIYIYLVVTHLVSALYNVVVFFPNFNDYYYQLDTGDVCTDVVGQWGPTLNAKHCIQVIYSMMKSPESDHPLEESIAQQLREKPKEFEKAAKKYTKDHAK